MSYVKKLGLDSREICCVSTSPNSKECGISFDEHLGQPALMFHHLQLLATGPSTEMLIESSHSMVLSAETIDQLIARLKEVKKQYRKQLKK